MVSQSGPTVGTINQPIGSDFWHSQRLATDNRIHNNCRELRRLRKRVNPNRSNRLARLGSRILSTIIRPLCRRHNPHKLSFMGRWQPNLLACQSPPPQWLADGSVDRRDLRHCNRFAGMVYSHDMGQQHRRMGLHRGFLQGHRSAPKPDNMGDPGNRSNLK